MCTMIKPQFEAFRRRIQSFVVDRNSKYACSVSTLWLSAVSTLVQPQVGSQNSCFFKTNFSSNIGILFTFGLNKHTLYLTVMANQYSPSVIFQWVLCFKDFYIQPYLQTSFCSNLMVRTGLSLFLLKTRKRNCKRFTL